jgi:P27 family predicted phage terminase small subunit
MATKRKPTALKILHGDFKKNPQRRNLAEPVVESAIPACPKTLKGEARAEWKRVTKELDSIKVLTLIDRPSLMQYCEMWAQQKKCQAIVEKEGQFFTTEAGIVEHPAAKAERQCVIQIRQYLQQFGMTPAARASVNAVQKAEPTRMRRAR